MGVEKGTCCLLGCICMLIDSSSPLLLKSSTSMLEIHLTPRKTQHGSLGRECVPSSRLTSTSMMKHCVGPNWISIRLNRSFYLKSNPFCEVRVKTEMRDV